MTVREDILTTTRLIVDDPSAAEHIIVERLVEQGYDVLRAELLAVFVPLGLARALIAQLELSPPIRLSSKALIQYSDGNQTLEVDLRQIPEFEAARQLGEETFRTGIIPREQFGAASSVSVEMKLINEALDAGKDIAGSTMAAPILLRLAAAPGFDEWYSKLQHGAC